ncbi:hypothetical protein ACH5RR_035396 [Cinchona calisaya]|uniref:CRAL-TRIO domain-containing protein n=1 Tax=Cinchona calisaya TaxID=153742 RepID=A0ABD2Y3E0_9GENT
MSSYLRQKFQFSSIWSTASSASSEEEKDTEEEEVKDQKISLQKDENERSKINIIRPLLEREDPSSKDLDDFIIRRFLRARDLDIEKASALLLNYLSWRKEFVPNGFISPSEIPNELAHDKLFMQGHDKLGRPIVVTFGGRHKPKSLEEFKRFVTFSLDKICARMPTGQEKFVCIADLEGWGYANSDVRGYIAALSILQDCYPERLGKLFIVHVPYVFMTAWKIVYPFIDSKTKKKIIFVENKKLESTLLRDIDESQLPETYGGKLPLVPIQDC